MASMASHHAEWLSLMEVSGPFLSVPVLKDALPNGLDAHDPHIAAQVRAAIEQWVEPEYGSERAVEVHLAFVRFVLHAVLGFDDDVLRWDCEAVSAQTVEVVGYGELKPDAVVMDGDDAAMLVSVYGPDVRVDEIVSELGTSTPQERMVEHLKATGLRVGLVTDGERWTLVSYQEGENPGFATWWSSLWSEEKITLQAFRTLLHQDRFLTLGTDETIGALLDRSAEDQREVTTKLGKQTLEAVEILIRTIDRIDQERGGDLLREVEEQKGIAELYDAAVTVMMRLIFLFYAEENDLLPMSEPLYVECYAASSLRERLQAAADEHGEEVLESTHDGWPRLLSTWRAVYGGIEHGELRLYPYGGSLFDPDRYSFLEGRRPGSTWLEDQADPLRIDNRTVLHLLNALQTLDEGGQRRKLSFRALDVEQIGHVYEGMLDHTAARAKGWVLGLSGTGGKEPEIELDELDAFQDEKALLVFLKDKTGRGAATNKKWIAREEAERAMDRFGPAWSQSFGDSRVEARTRRFAKLIRPDSTGAPTACAPDSVFVADSPHRGATGSHYTPRSLTEEVVKHTLDPLIFRGPSEGKPEDEWEVRTPEEILALKICDPACGSGAFLVQSCRYLADALVEASRVHNRRVDAVTEDEVLAARRRIAAQCVYGVDINPMACEMAKLSLWLVTLSFGKPFSFLDHAIRCGDSLVGVTDVQQLSSFALEPQPSEEGLFSIRDLVESQLGEARRIAVGIASRGTESIGEQDALRADQERLDALVEGLSAICDLLIMMRLAAKDRNSFERHRSDFFLRTAGLPADHVASLARAELETPGELGGTRNPFHWPLEFPSVGPRGFDAVVSNPPYLGGGRIASSHGVEYRSYLADVVGRGRRGKRGRADLCAYFLRRACDVAFQQVGLVVTNSIAETDTRAAGLQSVMDDSWSVARATLDVEWPGEAAVVVSKVWLSNTGWSAPVLNGARVEGRISSSLSTGPVDAANLTTMAEATGGLIQGSALNGEGFVISHDLAAKWTEEDNTNSQVILPFLTGADVTRESVPLASRSVICFWDWSEAQASRFVEPFQHVVNTVKLEREAKGAAGWRRRDYENYWLFHTLVPEIYERASSADWVAVLPGVAKHVVPVRVAANQVFSNTLFVAPDGDWGTYGLLLSSVHREWAHVTAARMGSGTVHYSTSSCFNTLDQPTSWSMEVRRVAKEFDESRTEALIETNLGLTELNNQLGDPACRSDWARRLRAYQEELDRAVLSAYEIELEPEWGFVGDPNPRYSFVGSSLAAILSALVKRNTEKR